MLMNKTINNNNKKKNLIIKQSQEYKFHRLKGFCEDSIANRATSPFPKIGRCRPLG